jgi:hypothetical protein
MSFCRNLAAGLLCLAALGCLDTNPNTSSSPIQSARVSSAPSGRPDCIDQTLLVVLDRDALSPGHNRFSDADLSCSRKGVGNRATLDWFARNIGQELTLSAGEVGNEGWFAFSSVRIAWKSAGPDHEDGLRNYMDAGQGLGSPDKSGKKESLLDKVPGLVPLRATGLARLEGRSVCALVLDGDVRMSYGPPTGDLRGPYLGKAAFMVLSVDDKARRSGGELPQVRIRVLDAEAVCADPLSRFDEAPLPVSSQEPRDAERPACVIQRTLLNEPWNAIDTALWRPDEDAVAEDGLFQARDGAGSAAADWIPKCPLALDTNTVVRFSNRIRFLDPVANNFVESGALFLINADADESFTNYAFLNVGFTGQPGKIFVETFGSSGGQDFDQFEESSVASSPSVTFTLDLLVSKDAYRVVVGDEAVDTVSLASPLPAVSLFEVGVQQIGSGMRGLVDQTTVSMQCKNAKESERRCRSHSKHQFCWRGGKVLCSPGSTPSDDLRKSVLVRGHIRCRNDLIRMAKVKCGRMAHPPKGLAMLAKLKEIPETESR